MIKETKIGNKIFTEETTYYIYNSEEDRNNDKVFVKTLSKKIFISYKLQAKSKIK